MRLADIILLGISLLLMWWLGSFDPKMESANRLKKYAVRALRCLLSLFVLSLLFYLPGAINTLAETLVVVAIMSLIWSGCLAEAFSRAFSRLVDPEDKRTFDPGKNIRDLDFIAELVKKGRKKRAIELCKQLREAGDASYYAVETLLEHLGVQQRGVSFIKPMTKAYMLRSQGKFKAAEKVLVSLMKKNPTDYEAGIMLVQIYAKDLNKPRKGVKLLENLRKHYNVPAEKIEAAENYIKQWYDSGKKLKLAPALQSKTIDELLNSGYFGKAIEMLEQKTAAQPQNFELWMKFAEVHAIYCGNLGHANKIIGSIESNSGFSAKQIQSAKDKLQEWRNLAQREM